MKTQIRGGTVVAFEDEGHKILEKGVVVFEGNEITHVGETYAGEADETIDASGNLVIPGLVNMHLHATDTAYHGELMVDQGQHDWRDVLYKYLPTIRGVVSAEDEFIAAECSFAELMLSGTTTAVELSFDYEMMEGGNIAHTEHVASIAGNMGLRCYVGPRYRSMHYGLGDDGKTWYKPYPNDGLSRFEDCVRFCRDHDGRFDGRLRTMLAPGQIDTCNPDLLESTREAANEIGVPIQIHCGQTSQEFKEINRRHKQTSVGYLSRTGLLGSDLIIGHGMFLSEDGDVDHCLPSDLESLRDSGTSIVNMPWVHVRQGRFMKSFAKYRRAGINMGIGTDTFPFDMIHEMQWAAILCKIAEQNPKEGSAREIFHAATVGGAQALNRDDLGRLAVGCKADIVILDLNKPHALTLRDPFKFMVFSASSGDVDTVIIDGKTVVLERRLLTCDLPAVLGNLREAITRVYERVPSDLQALLAIQ